MVKLLAPELKMMPFAVTEAGEIVRLVVLEVPKVAVSLELFGTVAGVQLAGLNQSELTGLRFQVALPA
jgi:hypothetical protein